MKNATAAPEIPTFDQNQNDALMKAIGAKGYDPMPPSQHLFYQDRDQPLSNRVVGVVYECTIRRGKDGKRSPVGREERSRFLTVAAIAKRLGVTVSNCWVAVRQAEADRRIRIDEDEHIWLGGNVREPRKLDGKEKAKEDTEGICAKLVPESILLYLKTLPPERADIAIRRQIEIAERFNRARADADALLRQQAKEAAIAAAAEDGYKEDAETRGRPRVAKVRPFSVRIEFTQNQNGHSAHNSESNSEQKKKGSAQIPHPYVAESLNAREQERVSSVTPAENAPLEQEKEAASPQPDPSPTPPPTPLTENLPAEEGAATEPPRSPLEDPDPIVNALQLYFHRELDPQIRAEWLEFGTEMGIPKRSVARWTSLVMEGKRARSYKVYSPGALLQFARSDMRTWIAQSWREIESDRKWEEAETRRLNEQLKALAEKKSMPGAQAQKAGQR